MKCPKCKGTGEIPNPPVKPGDTERGCRCDGPHKVRDPRRWAVGGYKEWWFVENCEHHGRAGVASP